MITVVEGDTLGVSAEGQIGREQITKRVHIEIIKVRTAMGTCTNGVTKSLWQVSIRPESKEHWRSVQNNVKGMFTARSGRSEISVGVDFACDTWKINRDIHCRERNSPVSHGIQVAISFSGTVGYESIRGHRVICYVIFNP